MTSYKQYDKWCKEEENSELEEILLGLKIL